MRQRAYRHSYMAKRFVYSEVLFTWMPSLHSLLRISDTLNVLLLPIYLSSKLKQGIICGQTNIQNAHARVTLRVRYTRVDACMLMHACDTLARLIYCTRTPKLRACENINARVSYG